MGAAVGVRRTHRGEPVLPIRRPDLLHQGNVCTGEVTGASRVGTETRDEPHARVYLGERKSGSPDPGRGHCGPRFPRKRPQRA